MEKKVEITQDYYLSLISKVLQNKDEERELSLDRYRKADEQMETAEQFALMGKNAVSFLKLASDSTNDIADMAKEIKSIVFKEESGPGSVTSFDDNSKKSVIDRILDEEKEESKKQEPTADSDDIEEI